MPGRILALSDIHGCSKALRAVVDACDPRKDDLLITLGDYVDRGDDVPGMFEQLLELRERCRLTPLLGNHDELLLRILDGNLWEIPSWLKFGGRATLEAYGADSPRDIPAEHIQFLRECHPWIETDQHFFVHANYEERKPLRRLASKTLYWESLRARMPGPHRSGKKAILGHTSQKDGEVLDEGHLICIDTFCYGGGWLTAMDVESGQIWQADLKGRLRPAEEIAARRGQRDA